MFILVAMNRFAFSIFGIDIAWYGIIMTSAIALATFLIMKIAEKRGYKSDDILDIALWVIPLAIIGARLYYVAFSWEHYAPNPIKILMIREGGMAIHGGIIGGMLGAYIAIKRKRLNFLDLIDIGCMPLVLAQGIGRWGNFMNGEAHGGPTDLPWAIEVGGQLVHPTFLYESLWDVGCFIILMMLYKNRKYFGTHFMKYLIMYSIGRFFIEGMRTDSLMFMGLRTAQLISVALIIFGIVMHLVLSKNPKLEIKD